jgi:hypothetical protein
LPVLCKLWNRPLCNIDSMATVLSFLVQIVASQFLFRCSTIFCTFILLHPSHDLRITVTAIINLPLMICRRIPDMNPTQAVNIQRDNQQLLPRLGATVVQALSQTTDPSLSQIASNENLPSSDQTPRSNSAVRGPSPLPLAKM